MRLEKKKVLQRIQQNKKRMNLFRQLHQMLLQNDALKWKGHVLSDDVSIESMWEARKEIVAKLAREKETYVDPNVFGREPIYDEPLFATPEQIDAAVKEQVPLVEKLIDAAVENKDIKLVEKLVFRNFPGKGHSRLEVAFRRGYLTAAQLFVDNGDEIDARDPRGQTLFHLLAKQMNASGAEGTWDEDHKKVEFLLRNNANPNLLDFVGNAPIFYAGRASYSLAEHVNTIMNELDYERNQKIKMAFWEKDVKALEDIIWEKLPHSARVDKPRFVAALEQGYDDIAEFFAFQGDNVDVRNENGETLLYTAAAELNLSRVCMLLRSNADPNAVSNARTTPLMAASFNRNAKPRLRRAVIRELLEYGADPNMSDMQWNSAFQYAHAGGICLRDELEIVKKTLPLKPYHMVLDKVYSLTR